GDTTRPGTSHSGLSGESGSVSKTSRAAPAIQRRRSASARSSSTTSCPRPMLTKCAEGRITPKRRASNLPRVSSVSGAAATTQSARDSRRSSSPGPYTPGRAVRPTRAVVTPSARSRSAIARPIGPEPTTHARVPATLRVSRCRQARSPWRASVRGRSFASASTSAATYSAIGPSKTPRALVTTVGEPASSGPRRWSTPALAVCTQRGRGPSPGQAARTACEVKSHTSSTSACGSRSASVEASACSIRARPVSRPSRGGGSASSTSAVGTAGVAGTEEVRGVVIAAVSAPWPKVSDARIDHARTRTYRRQHGRSDDPLCAPCVLLTGHPRVRRGLVPQREAGADMDVSLLGGPGPQRGVGVVAPFDFALDRELWRWVPDDVSLHLTRTPYVPVEVGLALARLISEHETLGNAVRTLTAVTPEVVAYACTSGSFVGGTMGERAMCEAMSRTGRVPAIT